MSAQILKIHLKTLVLIGFVFFTASCPGETEVSFDPDSQPRIDGATGIAQDAGISGEVNSPPDKTCKVIERFLPREPAEVLLLLDRSSSLDEQEKKSGVPWWTLVSTAMQKGIKASESTVDWGLMLYPKGTDSNQCCKMPANDLSPQVEVNIGPMNAQAIANVLDNTDPSGEGTPTAKALLQGANYLKARTTSTQKYIILVTDGDPTCPMDNQCKDHENQDYNRTKETIAYITRVLDIPIGVIGVAFPNSSSDLQPNPKQLYLIDVAKLGGMPNKALGQPAYYLATSKEELLDSIQSLYTQTISCTYATGLTAPWDGDIAIDLLGKNVPRDPNHEDGWDYGDGGKTIVFYGRARNTICQTPNQSKPHMRLGCPNTYLD